jgi:hypothetical protein
MGNNEGESLKKTGHTASMLIAGFFAALRGEKIVRLDVGSMREHWQEATGYGEGPLFPLMMVGQFKRETRLKLFCCQPLAMDSKSGVQIACWFHRSLWILGKLGVGNGPMFGTNSSGAAQYEKASVGNLDNLLHSVLLRAQKRFPNIMLGGVDMTEEYSVSIYTGFLGTSASKNKSWAVTTDDMPSLTSP